MGRDLGFFCSFQKMKGTAAQQGNYTGWKEKTKQSNQWQSVGWRTKCRLTKSPVRCNLDYFLSHPSSMLAAAATANSSQGGLLGQGPAEEVKWCLPLPADPLSSCFPAPAGRLLHCHLPICDAPHPAGSRGDAARGCWGDHFLPEARHVQAGRPTGEGWCQANAGHKNVLSALASGTELSSMKRGQATRILKISERGLVPLHSISFLLMACSMSLGHFHAWAQQNQRSI